MKLSELKIDAAKGEAGAWVRDLADMGDVAFRVRGMNNSDWQKLSLKLFNAVPRSKKINGKLDPDEAERIVNECLVETSLLDWSGILDDDGKPVPFSKELARKLIFDPDFSQFRNAVLDAAGRVSKEGVETLEAASGN